VKGDLRKSTRKRMELGQLAYRIKNQAQLERILASADPRMRSSILGLIRPLLRFKYQPPADSADSAD